MKRFKSAKKILFFLIAAWCLIFSDLALAGGSLSAVSGIDPCSDDGTGPGAVELISPAGPGQESGITCSWTKSSCASWYRLLVQDSQGEKVYAQWHEAEDICSDTVCSLTPDVGLAPGFYEWFVKSWNDNGKAWSTGLVFSVQSQTGLPGRVDLISPLGDIGEDISLFTWTADPEATWYRLSVADASGNLKFAQWYECLDNHVNYPEVDCTAAECGVTLDLNLTGGSYDWYVKTWNEIGKGPWSEGGNFTVTTGQSGEAVIIDHRHTDISAIPESWINTVKTRLKISYGHTSHGSQPVTGMQVLENHNALYRFNTDGSVTGGSLSIDDTAPDGDLGHNGDTYWADLTRSYLDNSGSDRNVVVWSWCGGVSDNTQAGIQIYLSAMNQLESDYPEVTFVYMTGHLDGTGQGGNLHARNNQIRQYCTDNGKILFDFADIERYNPDGTSFLESNADDGCYYDGGNWARQWCDANPGDSRCRNCDCAHSEPLNCNLKAGAFWWMLARIAGWDGE